MRSFTRNVSETRSGSHRIASSSQIAVLWSRLRAACSTGKHLYITPPTSKEAAAAAQTAVAVAGSRCCRPASHVLSHVEGIPESTEFLSFCRTSPDRTPCCRSGRPWCPSACRLRSRASCRICISWSTAHFRTPRRDDPLAVHMTPPNHQS